MKKLKLCMVVAALFISATISAQPLTFGPKFGFNFANQSGDVDNNKMLFAFNIGGVANYGITDMFDVQVELLFDKKGAKYEWETADGTQKAPLSLGYISIPIMGVANFPVNDDVTVFGELGPTISFLTSAKYDGEKSYEEYHYDPGNPFQPPTTMEVKYKEWYKGTDIGLAVGAGAAIPLAGKSLRVDLRYNFSFGTIHAKPESGDGEQENIRNGVLSLNAAFMFPCKRFGGMGDGN